MHKCFIHSLQIKGSEGVLLFDVLCDFEGYYFESINQFEKSHLYNSLPIREHHMYSSFKFLSKSYSCETGCEEPGTKAGYYA